MLSFVESALGIFQGIRSRLCLGLNVDEQVLLVRAFNFHCFSVQRQASGLNTSYCPEISCFFIMLCGIIFVRISLAGRRGLVVFPLGVYLMLLGNISEKQTCCNSVPMERISHSFA